MKPLKAKTILKIKEEFHRDKVSWSYWFLKSRKKIKKKNGVTILYEAEVLQKKRFSEEYMVLDRFITHGTIRNLYQNKEDKESIVKFNGDWETLKAKIFLLGKYED